MTHKNQCINNLVGKYSRNKSCCVKHLLCFVSGKFNRGCMKTNYRSPRVWLVRIHLWSHLRTEEVLKSSTILNIVMIMVVVRNNYPMLWGGTRYTSLLSFSQPPLFWTEILDQRLLNFIIALVVTVSVHIDNLVVCFLVPMYPIPNA